MYRWNPVGLKTLRALMYSEFEETRDDVKTFRSVKFGVSIGTPIVVPKNLAIRACSHKQSLSLH